MSLLLRFPIIPHKSVLGCPVHFVYSHFIVKAGKKEIYLDPENDSNKEGKRNGNKKEK